MKITQISVVDGAGVTHVFNGEGYLRIQSTNDGQGMKPKEWKTVSAHIKLEGK